MRTKVILAATATLVCSLTTGLAAQGQGQGIAIMPFAAYNLPGVLASEDGTYEMKPKGAPHIGGQLEFGLSKTMALAVGGGITIGQKLDINDISGGGSTLATSDLTTMQFFGALSIRPGGRRPNGAVTALAVELGGGLSMLSFGNFIIGTTAINGEDFNASSPFAFGGLAYNIPIGPRSSLQIFGRAQATFGYSSDGLDDFNSAPPPSNVEGKSMQLGFLIGAGLRVGR